MNTSSGGDKDDRQQRKTALDNEITGCRRCAGMNIPHETASAPGYGSINSPVALVGQSLCEKCMETQIPFTGGSGKLIDESLQQAGVAKSAVFTTNVVHCHPPGNRRSHDHEIENCCSYLHRELKIVGPRLVIGLGKDAERVLQFLYPKEQALPQPFEPPSTGRARTRPYIYFAEHPSWVKRQHDPTLEARYVSNLAAAVAWSFGQEVRATPRGTSPR